MVRNKCLDHLRANQPTGQIDTDDLVIDNENPQNSLEVKELHQSIDTIIDNLPERCRQVFVLSRFESMSYKEIAEHLQVSPKTVENQISKALKVLRIGLDRWMVFIF